jgi:hypothetical protein
MKWFSLFAVIFNMLNVTFPSAVFTASLEPVVIRSISYRNDSQPKETITFKLDAAVEPNIFFIPGEKPRLVLDFPQSVYLGKNVIVLSDSILASAIRIGLHQKPLKKTRAVIDLLPKMVVRYATEYRAQEHTLIVTLTPDSARPDSNVPRSLKAESRKVLSSQKDISDSPLETKDFSSVVSARKVAKERAPEKVVPAADPMILEISFDESSGSGEMVLIRVNGFYPPTVSAIETDTPQVLCDFLATGFSPEIHKEIQANGRYVKRIYATMQQDPEQVRVVLELLPEHNYDLQQVFFRNDNLFVLMVNELTPNQGGE